MRFAWDVQCYTPKSLTVKNWTPPKKWIVFSKVSESPNLQGAKIRRFLRSEEFIYGDEPVITIETGLELQLGIQIYKGCVRFEDWNSTILAARPIGRLDMTIWNDHPNLDMIYCPNWRLRYPRLEFVSVSKMARGLGFFNNWLVHWGPISSTDPITIDPNPAPEPSRRWGDGVDPRGSPGWVG